MAIIITQPGKKAHKVEQSKFDLEDSLQKYIYENPEVVPLYDIKENVRPLILVREYMTSSGPIDAIAIDTDGDIYLIETKLYRNADKRRVIAQVLDYGASLWKHDTDWEQFTATIEQTTRAHFQTGLFERMQQELGLSEAEAQQLWDTVRTHLDDSNYKFVVLMDSLEDRLKDLIVYLNQNSKFDIYAVELEYYKHDSTEIVIPKLFGAATKKDVTAKSKPLDIPADEDFLSAFGRSAKIQEYLQLFNSILRGDFGELGVTAKRTSKYLNIYIGTQPRHKATIMLHIDPDFEGGGPQFWADAPVADALEGVVKKSISGVELLPRRDANIYAKLAKWSWGKVNVKTLEDVIRQLAKEIN